MPDKLPVDLAHLHQYTAGDASLEREIYALFRNQVDIWMRMLQADAQSESWSSAAHSIKGSARGLGAHKLASACEAAEAQVAAGIAARSLAADAVREQIQAVLTFIDKREYQLNIQALRKSS